MIMEYNYSKINKLKLNKLLVIWLRKYFNNLKMKNQNKICPSVMEMLVKIQIKLLNR